MEKDTKEIVVKFYAGELSFLIDSLGAMLRLMEVVGDDIYEEILSNITKKLIKHRNGVTLKEK